MDRGSTVKFYNERYANTLGPRLIQGPPSTMFDCVLIVIQESATNVFQGVKGYTITAVRPFTPVSTVIPCTSIVR